MTKKHILIYGLKHKRWEYAKKFGYVSSYDEGTVPVFIDYYNTKITEILESEHSKKESKNESSFWHSAEEFKIFSKEWLNYVPEHTGCCGKVTFVIRKLIRRMNCKSFTKMN